MGTLRFADIETRPTEVLDLTSLTIEEFRELVPPFEAAFQAHMAEWQTGPTHHLRLCGLQPTVSRPQVYKTPGATIDTPPPTPLHSRRRPVTHDRGEREGVLYEWVTP
jgi:hypothetical protein